eukprot:Gb_03922 [translate_table: standard]
MDELESKGSESSANGPTLAKPHDSQGGGSHPIPLPLADSPSKKLRALPLRTQSPSCQVEKCSADLSNSKDYYRRHRVCEVHSKAPAVTVLALEQRFCQQCSRSRWKWLSIEDLLLAKSAKLPLKKTLLKGDLEPGSEAVEAEDRMEAWVGLLLEGDQTMDGTFHFSNLLF